MIAVGTSCSATPRSASGMSDSAPNSAAVVAIASLVANQSRPLRCFWSSMKLMNIG